jgi:hypothetical protein
MGPATTANSCSQSKKIKLIIFPPDFFIPDFFRIFYYKLINVMKKARTTKSTPLTIYKSVGPNIYFDGTSYRVRMILNGERYSKNLSSKRAAVMYRNSLLKSAV